MTVTAFTTIKEALSQPTSPFFWINHDQTGDPISFYSKSNLNDEDLSFNISNNMILANVRKSGSINRLVFYHGNTQLDYFFPAMWQKNSIPRKVRFHLA